MTHPADGHPPRIIWLLWLQGWDDAPAVARAGRASWTRRNPGWTVHALDAQSLAHFLPAEIVAAIRATPKEAEAASDQIRLELLHRYGGVWADATTLCARPLDAWLLAAMPHGFFAFARPGPDRMLSTWFLAAEQGALIVERWRAAAWAYWAGRTVRDSYFWVHDCFAGIYASDPGVRAQWDATPQVPAAHGFHFGPESPWLLAPPPADLDAALADPPVPVFKLTHKFAAPPGAESLFARLCDWAGAAGAAPVPPARRRLLVGWFGAFAGHGTIGDLRSLEAVVARLVARGHEVFHATAAPLPLPGATQVAWDGFPPDAADAVLFVCGPILREHPLTNAFFARFAGRPLVGLGVSLLPADHPNHADPFAAVFARQGGAAAYGDVAICAPRSLPAPPAPRAAAGPVIGLALRGEQHEYGPQPCLWAEAAAMFAALTDLVVAHGGGAVVHLENHLARAGCPADAIEAAYAACDLVLTTRFHGAIAALRQDVPFIALDQLAGGAKVLPLLAGQGWGPVHAVDAIGALDVVRAGLGLLADPQRAALGATRAHLVAAANRTLAALDAWLAGMDAAKE